jgi:hypothetical protein
MVGGLDALRVIDADREAIMQFTATPLGWQSY